MDIAVAKRPITLDQFLCLPEEQPALEYDGEVITQKMSPEIEHGLLQFELTLRFNRAWRGRRIAVAIPEQRTSYSGRSWVPDVAVLAWSRAPVRLTGNFGGKVFVPPDIAVEITSPEQSLTSLVSKCLWYVANGVHLALLIDVEGQAVRVFRPDSVPTILAGTDPIDVSDVFPGLKLTVRQLFAALKAR